MNTSTVGLVILAAGASTRMGTPKQLLPYQGQTLLHHIAEVAIASVCRPIVVVLGAQAERIEPEVSHLTLHVVKNLTNNWENPEIITSNRPFARD